MGNNTKYVNRSFITFLDETLMKQLLHINFCCIYIVLKPKLEIIKTPSIISKEEIGKETRKRNTNVSRVSQINKTAMLIMLTLHNYNSEMN